MSNMSNYLATSLLVLVLSASPLSSDSIWNGQSTLYSIAQRQINVGDSITVQIIESTTAAQEAITKTSKASQLSTNLLSSWEQIANLLGNENSRKQFEFDLRGGDDYKGTGQTSRKSQIKATITAIVTQVLDSGNLYVIGEHKLKVNNEVQTIRIAGIIRPQDISPRNTIFSYQLANAEIVLNGAGDVAQKQSPGVLSRMFNWLF